MSTARTTTSYLSTYTPQLPIEERRRLRKEEREKAGANVLTKPTSVFSRPSTMTSSGGGGGGSGSNSGHGQLSGRLAQVKEKARANTATSSKSRKDDLTRRNMVLDADGVAHDSEYVPFRTATPVHMHSQRSPNPFPNDDDSASSSSASSTSSGTGGRFPSTAYTSSSTYRTAGSNNQYSNKPSGSSASALPSHLNTTSTRRPSNDYYGSAVPSTSVLRRTNGEYDSKPSKSSSKSRVPQQSQFTTSSYQPPAPAFSSRNQQQFTTSSYQPPAPAFAPRAMDYNSSLRLPTRAAPSSDSNSLAESAARLSLNGGGGSGYNQYASSRPNQLEGTALDAGVHGMKRSFDGFKLDVGFAAHKVKKKLARKILNL